MQACSGILTLATGSCTPRMVHTACRHQAPVPAAAAAAAALQPLQQQQQPRRCALQHSSSSSSTWKRRGRPERSQAAAADGVSAEDAGSDAAQQQQLYQQQQQQQQRAQLLQYAQSPAASLVSTTWGVAERRAHLAALARSADSVDGLAAVWLRCRAAAGPAELTVLFNRLAAVCEPRTMSVKGWNNAKALLRELLIASEDRMALMAGPEFVYIIAALAKLRAAPDQAWLNR
ncbi:hypothetical protein COO60DRAFT_331287 [Scenedesmus sp. NREL 46B-D3]|nr:hypothetical protein COO60DRAFT_331287 [Scenedesmus sp. NREL 46B-D3]